MRDYVCSPVPGQAKTRVVEGRNSRCWYGAILLRRLITSRKGQFKWQTPSENPYIVGDEILRTIESRYAEVAIALSST